MKYTFDAVFLKEFDFMTRELSVVNHVDIYSLPLPSSFSLSKLDTTRDQVTFLGIEEDYYNSLNNTVAYLLPRPSLTRKKFDSSGNYVKGKDGEFLVESVTVPNECVAVMSKVNIRVPLKFNKEGYEYVDYWVDKSSDSVYYIYIIPRERVFKLNLCALCLSLDRPRKIYGGCQVYLTTGHKAYLYIAPFKLVSVSRNFRVILVKPSLDLKEQYKELLTFWGNNGIIYNIDWLWLAEVIGDRNNAGYVVMEGNLDEYICFDSNVSLANNRTTIEELDDINKVE